MNPVSISYAIVAHVKRLDAALALQIELTGPPEPPVALCLDDGTLGEWKNHKRAILEAAQADGATHVVLIQDDAVLIPEFREVLAQAITQKPGEIIGLYVGTGRPRAEQVRAAVYEAEEEGAAWLRADTLLWGVSTVLPVSLIPEMIQACTRGPEMAHDNRIGRWAKRTDRWIYYTWPSLVDHRDEPSVIKGRGSAAHLEEARVAHRTGVPVWTGLEVSIQGA